jgi:hypothetical protein
LDREAVLVGREVRVPENEKVPHCCETFSFPGGAVGDRTPDL